MKLDFENVTPKYIFCESTSSQLISDTNLRFQIALHLFYGKLLLLEPICDSDANGPKNSLSGQKRTLSSYILIPHLGTGGPRYPRVCYPRF